MNDVPQLLVCWSSRWDDFLEALGPALRPSPPKLRLEARAGLFPLRGMALALLLEAMALATAIAHPVRVVEQPAQDAVSRTHEVIYFSADELPQIEDLGGAAAGTRGVRGGASQPHRTQVIRVARDQVLREKVMDAPQLHLPRSASQISNLLAYKADLLPTPPPVPKAAKPEVPQIPSVEPAVLRRREPQLTMPVAPPRPEIDQTKSRSESLAAMQAPAVAPPPVQLPERDPVLRAPLASVAVAPPPVAAPVQARSRPAELLLPPASVAPPRPEINAALQSHRVLSEVRASVVPPPARLEEAKHQLRSLGDGAVAPPPPDLSHVQTQSTREHDLGVARVQPPAAVSEASARSSTAGIVLSPKPGNQPAMPAYPQKATLAMSPAGSAASGADGEGGGHGISRGAGPGAAPSGSASGAASAGTGKSTVFIARNTNSPYPGPGGAGIMNSGNPRVPGVSVSGGKNVITLPSFGSAPEPAALARSAAPKNLANGITVIAGPRAGGALNLYGALKGDRVYTIYIATKIGTAVMQFADPSSVGHPSVNQLVAPRALRAETPSDWPAGKHSKVLIACDLDRNGILKNARILQSDDSSAAQQIVAALSGWKFAPAFRGNEAVAVTAILGFGVDTN